MLHGIRASAHKYPPFGVEMDAKQDVTTNNDRWEEIRKKAATRSNALIEARASGKEASEEETIESRVARIQNRVAELTRDIEVQPGSSKSDDWKLTRANEPHPKSKTNDDCISTTANELQQASKKGDNWKLGYILDRLQDEDIRKTFESHNVSDLWLPMKKQNLRRLISNDSAAKAFLRLQEQIFQERLHLTTGKWLWSETFATHATFEDDEDLVTEIRTLGEGAYGVVDEVSIQMQLGQFTCVRKRMGRPNMLNAHKRVMEAFAREVKVMRQVNHPHCVKIIGSYTDFDHVNILSTPVADMDLATLLDQPLTEQRKRILSRGVSCLCNALNYLHMNNIRHEDLKPQNVLIRGQNILLTDFGFSLDFSDDSISTTTGRPAAWTIRYSAPEVLNFEPRNRASDIYSLGCVLTEMMSGIEGINLTVVKEHWKRTENRQPSFAQNPGAGTAWLLRLQRLDWDEHEWPHHHWNSGHPKDHALTWFIPLLIHVNRSYRPTSQQVVNHVAYLDMAFFCEDHANECCIETAGSREVRIAFTAAKSMSCRYLDQFCWPWRYGWVYGLWDLHCNMVYTNEQSGTVDTSHVIGEHNHDHHLWIIENLYQVQKACSRILSVACKTGRTRKFWEAHKPGIGEDPSPEEVEHVKISAHAFSLQHAVFTRVALVGGWQTPFGDVELECMQITLLPVCLPRSPYYGNFFWMFSYIARDGGYIGGEGQTYDVIDLTKTS